MTTKEQTAYRATPKWIAFRLHVLEKRNYSCYVCGITKKKGQHIHHLSTTTYGKETPSDVVVLCSSCHRLVERLLRRTKNKTDINLFCKRLKKLL